MKTGENEQALRKIIDLTRFVSIAIMLLNFYYFSYAQMQAWGLTNAIFDRIMSGLANTGLFSSIYNSKLFAYLLLLVSLLGVTARKDQQQGKAVYITLFCLGSFIFWISHYTFWLSLPRPQSVIVYVLVTSTGYVMTLTGAVWVARMMRIKLQDDLFNRLNESFPQEERLIENEYSINLPARYSLRGKIRKSWINYINPQRGLLVAGTPGAGKSYFVVRHIITQHLAKQFTMFCYDFKFDDLSIIVYNAYLKNRHRYKIPPSFYAIDFDRILNRCNPLDPATMYDLTDATESARSIMLGLNREWAKKIGDFFVESPINFVTAMIWFLRKFNNGCYCTLPHVIELMQLEYPILFKVLRTEAEIEVLINPFESAYRNEAMEQLEGQIASAKIGMARLSSPMLYYVLSGNDFTLDINNPDAPKIVVMGNNPAKQQVYGAVLSLYISRMVKLVNKKGKLKSSLVFDEFPTIYFSGIDSLIATARSNRVATTLCVQDFSQLKKDYGRDQAEVIPNIVGNIISGQVTGDTAKQLSERFGKIAQPRRTVSVSADDTSVSTSSQLEMAIPASRIASLSSGEFVGMVADNPDEKIDLKIFHCEILNDHKAIAEEVRGYKPIPDVRKVTTEEINACYTKIRDDIQEIVRVRLAA
jgi:hypothetical protein